MHTKSRKVIGPEIIDRIHRTLREEPTICRSQLALRVCEWLSWHNTAGMPQAMSCRKALLALHRRNIITLPEPKMLYAFQKLRTPVPPPPMAVIASELDALGDVALIQVSGSEQSRVWRGMMDAHHYLKSGPLCGSQLRYLLRSAHYGWLGGLSYSACARRVECRDAWIGWSEQARLDNHIRLVNNSRFLIAPTVKVKGLASHVLALAQSRVGADWVTRYGYEPVLLETYVEQGRFEGTCYKAANWTSVGHTTGRGRKGDGVPVKQVFLFPLCPDWQARLCCCADGTQQMRTVKDVTPPRDWIEAELRGAQFGDERLTARLLQMTGMFYAKPTASIPEACGSVKAAKAAYRFLDNEQVTMQSILQPHYEATEERIREHSVVLVAQDTTSLNYTTHYKTEGLGPISDKEQVQGLIVHDTLSFTEQGTPLGLLNVQWWARSGINGKKDHATKPIENKESKKWIESYRAVSAVQNRCRQNILVVVTDREGDIHELFVEQLQTAHGAQLLVRAERSRNRKVISGQNDDVLELLWSQMDAQPILGARDLLVPPREDRPARIAQLEVRAMPVRLSPPKTKPSLPPVPIWAVLAREPNPPAGAEALEWMLLTSVCVQTPEDAYTRLEWYARRWGIEVFHRVLKSGCGIEARQLAHSQRLMNCMAIDMIVAWRIYYLTSLGEKTADVPCSVYFSDSEWKALVTFVNRTKTLSSDTPPSLNEAVRLLGKLGGHLGRTGDGHPGCEVLWRGMARLADVAVAYDLYR